LNSLVGHYVNSIEVKIDRLMSVNNGLSILWRLLWLFCVVTCVQDTGGHWAAWAWQICNWNSVSWSRCWQVRCCRENVWSLSFAGQATGHSHTHARTRTHARTVSAMLTSTLSWKTFYWKRITVFIFLMWWRVGGWVDNGRTVWSVYEVGIAKPYWRWSVFTALSRRL